MKNLILTRHAKSSWQHPGLSDIDRPLNARGEKNAPVMGNVLFQAGVKPDFWLSSPAVRAYSTAKHFAHSYQENQSIITTDMHIYEASTQTLLRVIQAIQDIYQCVLLFGHNPGITNVTNFLCGNLISRIPTAGVACITLNIDHWTDVTQQSGVLDHYFYPKQIQEMV